MYQVQAVSRNPNRFWQLQELAELGHKCYDLKMHQRDAT